MSRLILCLCAALPACYLHAPQTTAHDVVRIDGDVTAVQFEIDAGNVTVRVAEVTQVEVRRSFSWSGDEPVAEAFEDQGTLRLTVDCGRAFARRCAVDHEVLLPLGATVAGSLGAGDVWVEGTGRGVDVATGSGDVQVINASGKLWLSTGAGDVVGEALTVDEIYVDSGAGDSRLFLEAAPRVVEIETGAGDVRVDLPNGRYRMELDTGAGQVSVNGIATDNASANLLRVRTHAGDINFQGYDAE